MSRAVEAILSQISQLGDEDRMLLDERLATLAETRWQREAQELRREAERQGIDQERIDQAVAEVRYGT